MPRPLLAAAVLLCAPAAGRAQRALEDQPRPAIYRTSAGEWRVDLPPAVEDAMDRYDPYLEPWSEDDYSEALGAGYEPTPRQLPWAVVGDFNGDGRPDVALAGRTDRDAVVLLILSAGRSRYRAVELEREPYDPEYPETIHRPVLSYVYPGRYVVADPRLPYPRELLVEQPAVQVAGGRREGTVLYVARRDGVAPYYLSEGPAAPGWPHARRP